MTDHFETRKQRFGELFDAHAPMLMAMLRRLARNNHDAEDAFQETAMRVWKYLHKAPRLRSPRGWLMTIGYRSFVDQLASRPPALALPADRDLPHCAQPSPAQSAEQSESVTWINAVIAELPDTLREVIVLHYTGGLTLRQTASAIGIPNGTVKSRLNLALQHLRKKLR